LLAQFSIDCHEFREQVWIRPLMVLGSPCDFSLE